jgi:hypothetical protein
MGMVTATDLSTIDEVRALGRARDILLAKIDSDGAYRETVGEWVDSVERRPVDLERVAVETFCLLDALARFGHMLAIAATRPSDQVTGEEALRLAYRTLCTASLGAGP